MTEVVSFRPTPEEEAAIESTRRSLGATTRTEAVRFLLKRGAKLTGSLADDPVWAFRLDPHFRSKKSLSSRDIDKMLYGPRKSE